MITKEIFMIGMLELGSIFNGGPDTNNSTTMEVWYKHLKDLDETGFKVAVAQTCRDGKFFPKPSELRTISQSINQPRELEAEEVFGVILKSIRWYGVHRPEEAMENLPVQIQQVVNAIGGYQTVCMSENLDVLRGQINRAAQAINTRNKTDRNMGNSLLRLVGERQQLALQEKEKIAIENKSTQTTEVERVRTGEMYSISEIAKKYANLKQVEMNN